MAHTECKTVAMQQLISYSACPPKALVIENRWIQDLHESFHRGWNVPISKHKDTKQQNSEKTDNVRVIITQRETLHLRSCVISMLSLVLKKIKGGTVTDALKSKKCVSFRVFSLCLPHFLFYCMFYFWLGGLFSLLTQLEPLLHI